MKKVLFFVLATTFWGWMGTASAGTAQGTLVAKGTTVTLKFAYLVKGPDAIDNKPIRKIILSATDLSAKIQACATMSCADGDLTEGMTVDLGGGERFNYWMVMKGGMMQHSGTKEIANLKISADDAKHLAGKLSFDDSGMGGPKVDATFDAALVKEFTKAR